MVAHPAATLGRISRACSNHGLTLNFLRIPCRNIADFRAISNCYSLHERAIFPPNRSSFREFHGEAHPFHPFNAESDECTPKSAEADCRLDRDRDKEERRLPSVSCDACIRFRDGRSHGKPSRWGERDGSLPATGDQRDHAGLDLWADRHRLHDGLRHHRHGQFRAWRRVHGRRFRRADHVPDRHQPGWRGSGGDLPRAVRGAARQRFRHQPLQLGDRARGLPQSCADRSASRH